MFVWKGVWCYSEVACRRQEVKAKPLWCNRSRGKKVREEGSATFHFVHSDMMKYLITASQNTEGGSGWRIKHTGRNEEGRQKRMKRNRRRAKEKSEFGGWDTHRHEQASKWQGEMNSWRRNLHGAVCAYTHSSLYWCIFLFSCLFITNMP